MLSVHGLCVMVCLGILFPALFLSRIVPSVHASSLSPIAATEKKSPEEIEYEVKAAFIYNFMRFIEWPEEKLSANRQFQKEHSPGADQKSPLPMQIGIVGKNPFGKAFSPILDKNIGDRPIELIQFDSFESYLRAAGSNTAAIEAYRNKYGNIMARCDLLFFSISESAYYEKLLDLITRTGALTLSDIPTFAEHGGMIGFVMDKNKVRFDINLESVEKEKLKIRSQLLELARQVFKKTGSTAEEGRTISIK